MFIGHFGLALASKKTAGEISLGTGFLAAQFIDLLWPFFLIAGIEKVEIEPGNTEFTPLNFISYPYSHSLAAVMIWALLFGFVHFLFRKNLRTAVILALLVLSHWILDFITHRPDLPLTFSEDVKAGLGLWHHKKATILVEAAIFISGAWLYMRCTAAVNRTGRFATWSLLIFLVLIYAMNLLGDPPPDARTLAWVGMLQWLFIFWGYWADNNRRAA